MDNEPKKNFKQKVIEKYNAFRMKRYNDKEVLENEINQEPENQSKMEQEETFASISASSPENSTSNPKKYRIRKVERLKKEESPKKDNVITVTGPYGGTTIINLNNIDNSVNVIVQNNTVVEERNNLEERIIRNAGRLGRVIAGGLAILAVAGLLRSCTDIPQDHEVLTQESGIIQTIDDSEVVGAREEVQNPGELLYALVQACAQEEMTDAEIKGVLAIQNTELYNWKNQETDQENSFDLADDFKAAKEALAEAEAKYDVATTQEEKLTAMAEITSIHQAMAGMYDSYSDYVETLSERFAEAANSSPDKIKDREMDLVKSITDTFKAESLKCNNNIALSTIAETYLNVGHDIDVEYGQNGVGVYVLDKGAFLHEQDVSTERIELVIGEEEFDAVVDDRGSLFETYARDAGKVIGELGDKVYDIGKAFISGVMDKDSSDSRD